MKRNERRKKKLFLGHFNFAKWTNEHCEFVNVECSQF